MDQSIVKTATIVDNSGLIRGRRMNVTSIDDVSVDRLNTGHLNCDQCQVEVFDYEFFRGRRRFRNYFIYFDETIRK